MVIYLLIFIFFLLDFQSSNVILNLLRTKNFSSKNMKTILMKSLKI